MTEATNQTAGTARALPHGLTEMHSGDGDAAHAALIEGIGLAASMLAQIFDAFGLITRFPAPQVPHTFVAALGDVAGVGGADPVNGEAFRAGLSHEAFAEVLAVSVRENYLISVERMRERLEAVGASTYDELAEKLEALEQAEAATKN